MSSLIIAFHPDGWCIKKYSIVDTYAKFLTYNCECSVAHVQALGIQLSPAFTVDILGPSGMFVLKRNHQPNCQPTATSENESEAIITDRNFRQIVTILRAQVMGVEAMDIWDEEEYDVDDDFDEDNPLWSLLV